MLSTQVGLPSPGGQVEGDLERKMGGIHTMLTHSSHGHQGDVSKTRI